LKSKKKGVKIIHLSVYCTWLFRVNLILRFFSIYRSRL